MQQPPPKSTQDFKVFILSVIIVAFFPSCAFNSFQGLQISTRELEEMGAQFCVALLRLKRLTGLHNHQHLLDLEGDIMGSQSKVVRLVKSIMQQCLKPGLLEQMSVFEYKKIINI